MTKESMADRIAAVVEKGDAVQMIFSGMSAAQLSAILQFGARKEELAKMFGNLPLSAQYGNEATR
jgi:hypothetical protein